MAVTVGYGMAFYCTNTLVGIFAAGLILVRLYHSIGGMLLVGLHYGGLRLIGLHNGGLLLVGLQYDGLLLVGLLLWPVIGRLYSAAFLLDAPLEVVESHGQARGRTGLQLEAEFKKISYLSVR
jgi:hypothetical protein